MKQGPIIHAVLLVAALLFAYQTWTREEVTAPLGGEEVVWSVPLESVQAIEYEMTKDELRDMRIEVREDERGPYLWAQERRIREQYKPSGKNQQDAGADGSKLLPKERVVNTREFMVGKKGAELFENMAELRALRALGQLTPEQLETYELDKGGETFTVITADGTRRTLALGGRVFGNRDRYALMEDTGIGFVLSEDILRSLLNGESSLRLLSIHDYEPDDVGKAVIEVGEQQRLLVRTKTVDEQGRERSSWADVQTPDKPDQTMANFVRTVGTLRPARYAPELDRDQLKPVVRIRYQNTDGAELGWVVMYRRTVTSVEGDGRYEQRPGTDNDPDGLREVDDFGAAPVYYMETEETRVPAVIAATTGSRISDDVAQIFAQ